VELKMSALKVLLRLAPACASASAHVQVDGAGSVTVDGALWLASATPRFFCGGWRDLGPGKQRKATHGSDALGAFKEQVRTFATTDGGAGVELALKTYGGDVFVLEQRLRHGCAHTQASPVPLLPRDSVETADTNFPGMVSPFLTFPAWNSEDGDLKDLRYLTWQGGNHAIYQWTVQESHGHDITQPHSDGTFWGLAGLSSGPVVLMKEGPNRTALPSALVVGPLTNPKLATSVIPEIVWEMGVSSEVTAVPAGFVHRTLLSAAAGPTRAMIKWGGLAQRAANLTSRFEDIATSKLGYFTDNGAMLYGDAWGVAGQKHGGDLTCCNETVMRNVTAGLEAQGIPYSWIQMGDYLPVLVGECLTVCTCCVCLTVCTCCTWQTTGGTQATSPLVAASSARTTGHPGRMLSRVGSMLCRPRCRGYFTPLSSVTTRPG
jgi:hypothetical protein